MELDVYKPIFLYTIEMHNQNIPLGKFIVMFSSYILSTNKLLKLLFSLL